MAFTNILFSILDKVLPSGRSTDTGSWIGKLFLAIIIDMVGLVSYLVPGLGESIDLLWAPISSFLIYRLFGSGFFALVGLVEEALPGMDFIPTASLACLNERFNILSWIPSLFGARGGSGRRSRAR